MAVLLVLCARECVIFYINRRAAKAAVEEDLSVVCELFYSLVQSYSQQEDK